MHKMEELKYKLCKELDEYAEKQKMSAGDLEIVHKLSDTIKNLAKIEMLEEEGDGGSSYGGGSSYARGGGRGRGRNAKRDSMGRYSREGGGYSQEGYSEEGYSEAGGSYRGGSSYAGGGGGQGGGNRGGGGGRGGYSQRGGYSRDGAKDYMIEQLEEMMEEVENPKDREALQRCLRSLEMA